MAALQGLINRVLSEEGYIEEASDSQLDSKTENRGDQNYTKYARDVNAVGLMGCQAQPWCRAFQFWLELKELFCHIQCFQESWKDRHDTYSAYGKSLEISDSAENR